MRTIRIFLASSSELSEDRAAFEEAIGRKNKDLPWKGVFLHLDVWEDTSSAVSPTRSQDEYNKLIDVCDIFVVLFWTKVGRYTREEFERAYGRFLDGSAPRIFTYQKEIPPVAWPSSTEIQSREQFQQRLGEIQHFPARYERAEGLCHAFNQELDRFLSSGDQAVEVVGGASSASHAQIREAYLDWLRKSCNSVELLGLDLGQSADIDLEHVYVPAVTDRDVSAAPHAMESAKEGPFLLLEALGHSPLYVPGHAGSGKSTFCRWVARVVAEGQVPDHLGFPVPDDMAAFRETLPARLVGKLPILCRLRDWASYPELLTGTGWTRARLESSLSGWLGKTTPGGLTGSAFLKELSAGNCLLILDGVDEVPERIRDQFGMDHWPQDNLLVGLADAMPVWRAAGNWLLLTSRPANGPSAEQQRSLGLQTAEIAELPTELQALFVRRWFEVVQPARAEALSDGLWREMDAVGQIGVIRGNPMLLAALCAIYAHGARLPRDVLTLYDTVIQQVLCKRFKADHETARHRLAAIAFGMHGHGDGATPAAEVSEDQLDRILARFTGKDLATDDGFNAVQAIRQGLLERSGLLLSRGGGRVVFYHLSFQEFLAAEWLNRRSPSLDAVLQKYAPMPAWRLTLRFLSGFLARRGESEAVAAWKCLLPYLEPAALEANPAPTLVLADSLEIIHAKGWPLNDVFKAPLLRACDHALHHLPPDLRAQLWLTRGRLGLDDRPGVGLRTDGLPDILWGRCEAGDFLYGEDRERYTLEMPFKLAVYPVTNLQFRAFVEDGGYIQDEWWEGLGARPARRAGAWTDPNAPLDTISWFEAMAFCRWLEAKLRVSGELEESWQISLPTEAQWERAARGTGDRIFPWGDSYVSGSANIYESGGITLNRTSPVGVFPAGKASSGALDMSGNVCEWCRDKYEYGESDMISANGHRPRTARGGFWFMSAGNCRISHRYWFYPDRGFRGMGFRVCYMPVP